MADDFAPLIQAAGSFRRFHPPWYVAGGWAIDLAVNQVTREHGDFNFCIFREAVALLFDQFRDWDMQVMEPIRGEFRECLSESDTLPPRHELVHCNLDF